MGVADLIKAARDASLNAYAPYSNFKVGCAVQASDGSVFVGANVENSAFGSALCAERVAISAAITAGKRDICRIVVYNEDVMPNPCGACLQVISELAPGATVTVASGREQRDFALAELMPNAFCQKERLSKR